VEISNTTVSDAQPQTTMKAKLHEMLTRAQSEFETFVGGLSDEERATIGEKTRWSAKDNLAHMAYWLRHTNEVFAALRNGTELPADDENFQPINERVFAEWRDRPWAEVIAEARGAYVQLIADVADSTEEELTDPEHFPQLSDGPLSRRVLGSAVGHPAEHYSQFYLEHGKLERATETQTQLVAAIHTVFGMSEEYGDAMYNLGCFYAKTGQSDAAIDALRQSFPLHTWLIEWSRHDSDLDSIRDLSAFQALYP